MRDIVVAARDLPTGHRLAPDDLALARVPVTITPAGTTADPAELAGSVLAAPVLGGEPVSSARLAGSLAHLAAPPGSVPLPVRFSDPAAVGLLSAGQVVDILAARATGADDPAGGSYAAPAQVIATGARVLAVTGADSDDQGLTGTEGTSGAPLVVVALTPTQARAVAGAEATSRLSFTLGRAAP
jgi:Flp pilus assembly protein CpaB